MAVNKTGFIGQNLCEGMLFYILQEQQKLAQKSIPKLDKISVGFFLATFFFLAPCTKKYSSPRDLRCLSGCYSFHAPACPRAAPTSTSLTCLISSHSFACVQLCPLAEVAHLLSLGTDFKGPGHIWFLRRGYEAPRTLKAWGKLETNKQNCCWWLNGPPFFFFPEKNLSITSIYEAGHSDDHDWW